MQNNSLLFNTFNTMSKQTQCVTVVPFIYVRYLKVMQWTWTWWSPYIIFIYKLCGGAISYHLKSATRKNNKKSED